MTTKVTFRSALASDADAIGQLVRTAYAKWIPVIGREPKPMTVDYSLAVTQNDFELLFDGVELAGLVETIRKDDCLWIENLAVAPHQHGKGFGRRLLARAEELAQVAQLGEIRLLTNADFRSNVALYHRAGYAVTHVEPFMGGITVYMAKRPGACSRFR
jgi:GNAT superfamily N-acetyltransferase